jgi:hypothetical protein
MKKRLPFLFLLFLSFGSLGSYAQTSGDDGIFSLFEANVFGSGSVEIAWIVQDGQQCFDVEVQRSLDGVEWSTRYIQAGLCGGDTRYAWLDTEPILYQPVYYRLQTAGGDRTRAQYFEYRFLEPDESAFIFPHPIREKGYFTFHNPDNITHELSLYDLAGRPRASYSTRLGNTLEIDRAGLESGQYVYILRNAKGESLYRGLIRVD